VVINVNAQPTNTNIMKIEITSTAFKHGGSIPKKYTGEGKDVSPPLTWKNIPPATKSLVLICDDPDAPRGVWVHWVVYDLPAEATGLAEGVPKSLELSNGAKQGVNDFGLVGYNGPLPPPGKPHRYFFKLYALDIPTLGLKSGATKAEVEKAMQGHILGQGELMGTYQR